MKLRDGSARGGREAAVFAERVRTCAERVRAEPWPASDQPDPWGGSGGAVAASGGQVKACKKKPARKGRPPLPGAALFGVS